MRPVHFTQYIHIFFHRKALSMSSRKNPALSLDRVNSFPSSLESVKSSVIFSGTIGRIRDSIAARKEKEILETNYAKRPLTLRNVETLVEAQRIDEACNPSRTCKEVLVSQWLHLVLSVREPVASPAIDEEPCELTHLKGR